MMQAQPVLNEPSGRSRLLLWLLLSLLAAASMWCYVMLAWPESVVGLSDLYPRWYGSRELLLHRRNPYSPEVTRDIQIWRGKLAAPGEDQSRFAYPLYVSFLLAPTVSLNFSSVNQLMFWLLLALAAASIVLFLRYLSFSPLRTLLLIILLLSLGSFPVAFAVRLRQLAIVSAFFIALALALLAKRRYAWAGMALALATIKPQLTFLLVGWLLLWTIASWRARRRFFWSFILSMGALAFAAEILVRHWIEQFVTASVAYVHYTDGRSILQVLFTRAGGSLLALLVLAGLSILCYRYRHAGTDSSAFALCTVLVLAITLIVIPTIAPHGQILLIPAMLFLFQNRQMVWSSGKHARLALVASCLLLGWQWVNALAYALIALLFGPNSALRLWMLPLSTSPVLPITIGATLVLLAYRFQYSAQLDFAGHTSTSDPRAKYTLRRNSG